MDEKKRYNCIYCYCTRVGTFGTESAVRKTWWQQEFAVFKCGATANSVTGHVCVNRNYLFMMVYIWRLFILV